MGFGWACWCLGDKCCGERSCSPSLQHFCRASARPRRVFLWLSSPRRRCRQRRGGVRLLLVVRALCRGGAAWHQRLSQRGGGKQSAPLVRGGLQLLPLARGCCSVYQGWHLRSATTAAHSSNRQAHSVTGTPTPKPPRTLPVRPCRFALRPPPPPSTSSPPDEDPPASNVLLSSLEPPLSVPRRFATCCLRRRCFRRAPAALRCASRRRRHHRRHRQKQQVRSATTTKAPMATVARPDLEVTNAARRPTDRGDRPPPPVVPPPPPAPPVPPPPAPLVPLAAGFEGPAAEMGLLPVCVCIPYVYACWQKRCEILHPEHSARGRWPCGYGIM